MLRREKKIESLGSISSFMNREHHKKAQNKKEYDKANKIAIASGSFIPLTFLGVKSAFAAEGVNQCGQTLAVAGQNVIAVGAPEIIGKATVETLMHIFDPLITLLTTISFPVASALILFKLFMGFFRDQGEVWEGIGRISLVYILIQMFPIFSSILKSLGNAI